MFLMNLSTKRPLFALPFIIFGTLSLVYFGALAPGVIPSMFTFTLIGNEFVDAKLKYQIVTLGIALLVLAITYFLVPQNSRQFYKIGDLKAPAEPIRWLGIKPSDTWKTVGGNFAVIVTLATGAFIYFNIARGQSLEAQNLWLLPVVLLLSALNAFTEEAITRLSVVASLDGIVARPNIYILSALIFGIPHYFGVPGGFLGALMAGFLGWLLAKSIAETKGMFWAWFIHFLQDVIIFTGLFLVVL